MNFSENGRRWIDSARYLAAWASPALLGLYLKWYEMVDQSGLAKATRSLGLSKTTIPERLSFFQGDMLVGFVIIPILLLVTNRYLPRPWSAIVTGATAFFFLLLFAVQLLALDELGRYISLTTIVQAASWGAHEPGAYWGYLSNGQAWVCFLGMAWIPAALWWSVKTERRAHADRMVRALKAAAELYCFGVFLFFAIAWNSDIPKLLYDKSVFARSYQSLWTDNVEIGEYAALSSDAFTGLDTNPMSYSSEGDLIARYRELSGAPVPERSPRYFGKERGSNVLFFVLETTADWFLPADDDMKQFPNLGRLRERSFIATRQYTSFPRTWPALFSVFSSWYPIDGLKVRGFPDGFVAPDFFHHLNAAGYQTAVFSPLDYPGDDSEPLYQAVDIADHIYLPSHTILPPVPGLDGQPSWKAARIGADLVALHTMEARLDEWSRSDRKFAAAFVPQVGHYPYSDQWSQNDSRNIRERARAVIAMEDKWLGELIALLEKDGQLGKTLIVVVGDHGPRTIFENPALRRGTIDEAAFHVPLLIYAPRTLEQTERIPWITSHIDIVPTILDLLGIREGRESEQGSPIWEAALAERTTFFIAKQLFEADGYAARGNFFMWNYPSNSFYVNSKAAFTIDNIVSQRSATAQKVKANLTTMIALERAWHAHFAKPASTKSEPLSQNPFPPADRKRGFREPY